MTEQTSAPATRNGPDEPPTPDLWAALTAPFPEDEHELLPKQLRKDERDRYQCRQGTQASADGVYCGGYHARSIHLTYVGHAGITMRLNAVDPWWHWEPMSLTSEGLPRGSDGGMWIRLTVLGVTRIGFGDAQGKGGPNAVKEMIGDAIRNAAMRFGVGTYLWSKSEKAQAVASREGADEDPPQQRQQQDRPTVPAAPIGPSQAQKQRWCEMVARAAASPWGTPARGDLITAMWQEAGQYLSTVVDVPLPWQPIVGSSRSMLGDLARVVQNDSRITALPEETA